ncbi:MAG: hypothetical protein RBR08_06870 [Desulforegulaceae bacterium]|nr:hypothetical protein [Desulforegulaceae bacterium]
MRFETRIFFTALTILILTLSLNSILSISSFEHVYEKSLISTFEAGGKNLKRKIEQSLLFGKPLDNFEGMEKLLKDFTIQHSFINSAGILNSENKIIYHSNPSKPANFFKIDDFKETQNISTKIIQNSYTTLIPLFSSNKKIEGYLFFDFPEKTISEKIFEMIFSNMKLLVQIIFFTGIILIFMLGIFITKPLKSKIKQIILNLENKKTYSKKREMVKTQNEIYNLELSINNFSASFLKNMSEIESFKNNFSKLEINTKDRINKSHQTILKYLKENPGDHEFEALYESFEKRNKTILKYFKISSILLESSDFTGKKYEI